MPLNPFREAGLPTRLSDVGGPHLRYNTEIAVVRQVYPETWCADIQPQSGGMLYRAQIADYALPDVHINDERPSYVEFWHRGGNLQDVWCRRVHWRRFQGPETEGDDEKRYYHKHLKIERIGDITIRITPDQRVYLFDAESGDYCLYDQGARTFHVIAPHIFFGTDEQNRVELHTGNPATDQMRTVISQYFMGKTALPDMDGITYIADTLLHLMSDVVKISATSEITLDPPRINIGHASASEHLLLGDAFMALYNAFVTIFNAHQHGNVQNGAGVSGAPTTPTSPMSSAQLSDVAYVSKTGL